MKRTYQTSNKISSEDEIKTTKQLKLGYLNLSENFFEQAEMNFKIALELDGFCADAYWGLMLAKLKVKNEDELYSNPLQNKDATKMMECKKALEFADENTRKIYLQLLEQINKVNQGENY